MFTIQEDFDWKNTVTVADLYKHFQERNLEYCYSLKTHVDM